MDVIAFYVFAAIAVAAEAGLALSEAPALDRVGDAPAVRGVFRRTGAGSVA